MADNSKVISIFQDMVKYWRERAKDYIENDMEEDDSFDDIEDPIYAKLRFCDIIDNYLKNELSEKSVEEIVSELYETIPEEEQTEFFIEYFVEYAISLGDQDYYTNNDKTKTLQEKMQTTVMYGMIKEMVAFIDDKYGQYGMEILEDEVASGEYMEEGEHFTFAYFDRQYEELQKDIVTKSGKGGFHAYELLCHLVAVIDSFSEEDKKKAGKERNDKFNAVIDTWKSVADVMNKAIDSVIPDLSDNLKVDIEKLDK